MKESHTLAVWTFVAVGGYAKRDGDAVSMIAVIALDAQPVFSRVVMLSPVSVIDCYGFAGSGGIRRRTASWAELGSFGHGISTLRTIHSHSGSLWVATPFYLNADSNECAVSL
jgi:hypothetical protein